MSHDSKSQMIFSVLSLLDFSRRGPPFCNDRQFPLFSQIRDVRDTSESHASSIAVNLVELASRFGDKFV